MVSAERVLGYCKVPQEASLESEPGCKPEDDWPTKGNIEVRFGKATYRHVHRKVRTSTAGIVYEKNRRLFCSGVV